VVIKLLLVLYSAKLHITLFIKEEEQTNEHKNEYNEQSSGVVQSPKIVKRFNLLYEKLKGLR
jgi:hypothetical protein